MSDVSSAVLGTTRGDVVVSTSVEVRAVTLALVSQARRYVDIASRQLDPPIYDDAAVLGALQQVALGSRYARIRILLREPQAVLQRSHRLLELMRRLTSYIEMRAPGDEDHEFNEALLLVDDCGYLRRVLADRYEGVASFSDRPMVSDLRRRYDAIWARAAPDPNLGRLHL